MTTINRLTHTQLRELEAELLGERRRIERSIATTAPVSSAFVPATTDVDSATQGSLGLAVESRERVRFDAITDALDRLANGSYGTCARCGDPIPYGRLIVMPEVSHCVGCSGHL
jgi:DnaK suppressor protein